MDKFVNDLNSIDHVQEIHDLHVWNLTFGKPVLTAHIVINHRDNKEYVLRQATLICRKVGIYHSTI